MKKCIVFLVALCLLFLQVQMAGAASPLVNQNFEGTGYDNGETWTGYAGGAGITDPNYATSPLLGSQSLRMKNDANEGTYAVTAFPVGGAGYNALYGFFRIKIVDLPASGAEILTTYNITSYPPFAGESHEVMGVGASGRLYMMNVGTGYVGTLQMQVGTTYYVWWYMQRSTTLQSTGWIKISSNQSIPDTNDITWSGQNVYSFGGPRITIRGTNAVGFTMLHSSDAAAGVYEYVVDQVLVSESAIGNDPFGTPTPPPVDTDTQPPTAPAGLSATVVSQSQINLYWGASTDNVGVTKYFIERCQYIGLSCSNFSQIATATVPFYSNTGLTASTTYGYQVRASDAAGNISPYSNTIVATTLSTTPPPPPPPSTVPNAPSSLRASAISRSQINLSWTDNSTNENGFSIERCQGYNCSNFVQIGSVSANVKTYSNTGLNKATWYTYRVRAYNASGNSGYSNKATTATRW